MDPSQKVRTVAALKEAMSSLSPRMRVAGKYIIDHPAEFGLDPIRDTARKAGVSTYTLVNIAKKLGFAGYEELREPFRFALTVNANFTGTTSWIDDLRGGEGSGGKFAEAAQNAVAIAKKTLERQNIDELEAVADTLLSAQNVYLTAVRASYSMAYYLHYVGRMALPSMRLVPRHINSSIDDLNDVGPNDVLLAITITPYSRETVMACEFAQKRGAKLVLITDSEVVVPSLRPSAVLVASVVSTHHFGCFSGMLALIESLIALLVHRGEDAAKARIKSYETLRNQNNAYWVEQKKH